MQVVRVSTLTSKVIEASNYFTEKPGQTLLVPIIKARALKEDVAEITSTTTVTSANFGVTKEGQDENERVRQSVRGTTKAGVSAALVHDNRRMITFDSTDPEFDEDSDPDADLDL